MKLDEFRNAFEEQLGQLSERMLAFPWEDPKAYALYMKQTWAFTRHTGSLLALCGARLMGSSALQQRFFRHVAEELGHDELARKDIERLGADFDALPSLSITLAFVQSQYYTIEHVDPRAFFGYILLLEALPSRIGGAVLTRVSGAHGLGAASFIQVHVDEDPDHVDLAWAKVADFDDATLDLVAGNFRESFDNFRLMVDEVERRSR